jgi:AcrR family transcriptional regulator
MPLRRRTTGRATRRAVAAVPPPSLSQRKRQLVRQEISHAAWLLFAERGYEDTSVGEIARAAGISRRSFFRYFSSKEDVVIGTTDALAEEVLAAFASRPASEPPLVAIQRALTPAIVTRLADADEARAIVSLLRESRTLRRAMLERHARLEERLAVLIAVRTGADPRRDPTPALLAFLARALLDTAWNVWYDQRPRDVAAMIDDLFRRLRAVVSTGRSARAPTRSASRGRSRRRL